MVVPGWQAVQVVCRSAHAGTSNGGANSACQRVSQPNASLPVAGVRDMDVPWLLFD